MDHTASKAFLKIELWLYSDSDDSRLLYLSINSWEDCYSERGTFITCSVSQEKYMTTEAKKLAWVEVR